MNNVFLLLSRHTKVSNSRRMLSVSELALGVAAVPTLLIDPIHTGMIVSF